MIPNSLTIAGFLSYRDPVKIDFSGVDLLCITGANGAGKSSILDAITWALFGRARKHDESIINLDSDRAEVSLEFTYQGTRYRVVRTNPRGKTKSVDLFREKEDGEGSWIPLSERTIRETDQKITDILRLDYETFINAVFFLQGEADQFTQQTPAARKRILSQILNLQVWETYRARAAQSRRKVESEVQTLNGRIAEIHSELQQEAQRRETLRSLQQDLEHTVDQRQQEEQRLDKVNSQQASLEEQRQLVQTLQEQLDASANKISQLQVRISQRGDELKEHQQLIERQHEVKETYQQWQHAREELSSWEKTAARFREEEEKRQQPLLELAAEEARLRQEVSTLEAEANTVQELTARIPELTDQLGAEEHQIEQAQEQLQRREEAQGALEEARQQQAEAQAENPRLYSEMMELHQRIEELEDTDGAHCPLCGQPLSAEERTRLIQSLRAEGKDLGDRFRTNKAILAESDQVVRELQLKITQLSLAENRLRSHSQQADRLKNQLNDIKARQEAWRSGPADRLLSLKKILEKETFAPAARQKLNRINGELKEIGYDAARHDQVRSLVEQGEAVQGQLRALEKAQVAAEGLTRKIADLRKQLAEEEHQQERQQTALQENQHKLKDAETAAPDLSAARKELLSIKEEENILQRRVGAAQQKVAVLERQREKLSRLEKERRRLIEKGQLHRQLEEALGKNGVPALVIEHALPDIEAQANQILEKLSGGTMSIRFLAQTAYRDTSRGDKKETLELQIQDQQGSRDYEMYSGGESFRINFAVRLALSHLLSHRAGAKLQTLVIDEGFGSQDEIGRQRLIEAINLIREDFKKILVITHVEEIQEAFSTQLLVEKTPRGSQVSVL